MDLKTEIRKLNTKDLYNLIRILDYDDSWMKLMAVIPKTLTLDNDDCKLPANNLLKYNTDHIKLIDSTVSKSSKKSCAEILLDEWGCSGKIQPRLGHLINLLKKTELYRAADYVAVELLNMPPVERPLSGPAAKIAVPQDDQLKDMIMSSNYPSLKYKPLPSSLFINETLGDVNLQKKVTTPSLNYPRNQYPHDLPDIIINNNLSNEDNNNIPDFSDLLDNNSANETNIKPQNENVIRTSNNNYSEMTPDFSKINETKSDNFDQNSNFNSDIIPQLSIFNESTNSDNSNILPKWSQLDVEKQTNSINADNFNNQKETNIPAFSQIMSPTNSYNLSNNTPVLSSLSPNTNKKVSFAISTSSNSRTCPSPLPNLSLNTILPHFTYQQLEQCTNSFDETILSDPNLNNITDAANCGRKLGSGAFGTVYLGLDILDKPVAVKKLNLNGVNVVNVDDTITKQFRNEVEILCKYKHDNLLALLGYSFDGPTYCLIYEYISGGALKDKLMAPEKFRLLWTERLYIALGTAKAVAHLHNAYSMPLIHRDIKSANILLDGSNKPKLCDFGLIKLTPNANTNTSTTAFGTSAYMAPEAFRGDVSVKLDTFSFGVVLLELLTSLPPLDENREGNDLVTHIDEICDKNIRPLLDMNAGSWSVDNTHFGDELFIIASQCLEEKKQRPVMSAVVTMLSDLIQKSVP